MAVEFCSQQGLVLALPQKEEENNVLTQLFGDNNKMAWINVNSKRAEGNFETDMKKQPLTFTKWADGQPNKSIQDTGCTMLSEDGVCFQMTKEILGHQCHKARKGQKGQKGRQGQEGRRGRQGL
ncbi:hypothetical protein Q5P01_012780 [Channa striata]|uniref:C-type lectin domain-containing protein n=1 Tax=Channa striata TaxID=64152 RepID=A0AA88MQE1_CHASR|nr:hypothetical protein Q5P01_012780 [Channa striata]